MRLGRRALAALLAVPMVARAQDWPARPIRLVIPFPPGGAADVLARMLTERIGPALNAQFVVENRPGGNTVIAAEAVARAAPDGHTLLLCAGSTMASVPILLPSIPYHPDRDFVPVGLVSRAPFFLFVPTSLPANSFEDFLALARAQPGALAYASNANGSSGNIAMEQLKHAKNLDIVHVPYRSYVPALTDMLAGRIQAMFVDLTVAGAALQAGQVKVLASANPGRNSILPEQPTVAEMAGLPGFDAGVWFGLFAPTGTPAAVVQRINEASTRWLETTDAAEALRRIGQEATPSDAAGLAQTVRADRERYGRIIRETGVKLD